MMILYLIWNNKMANFNFLLYPRYRDTIGMDCDGNWYVPELEIVSLNWGYIPNFGDRPPKESNAFNWTHHLCDRECWLFFASRIVSSHKRLSTLCHKDYNIFIDFLFATSVYSRWYQRSIAIMFKDPGKETRCLKKLRTVTTGHHINRWLATELWHWAIYIILHLDY